MADNQINLAEFQDFVMAQNLAARAFMLSVSVELARMKPAPAEWARNFISALHARIDVHEQSSGPIASQSPVHETARKEFDVLGQRLDEALRSE
jgi:CO dehydrogenase/acetyl-CoA synthase delta subunit